MKKTLSFLSLIILSGCQPDPAPNNYDIKQVGKSTYLINQKTGDLSVVEQGKVINLKEFKLPKKNKLSLSGSFKKKLKFEVDTKFIVDRMYYRLILDGYVSSKMNEQGEYVEVTEDFEWFANEIENHGSDRITIQLSDVDGFTLEEKEIYLSKNFIRYRDADGKIDGFLYEGSFSVNPLRISEVNSLYYTYRMNSLNKAPK